MPRSLLTPLLAALAFGVLGLQAVVLPSYAASIADRFPELEAYIAPLAIAAVAAGVCVQLALVSAAQLVPLMRAGRPFDRRAAPWLDVIAGAAGLAAALGIGAFLVLDGPVNAMPPSLAGALILAIGGAAAALVLAIRARPRLRVESASGAR